MVEDDLAALRERWEHSWDWARKFLDMGDYIMSIQSCYFAAFYAAKAALIHSGVRSKSHRSVQDRIDDLVEAGVLPTGVSGSLESLLARRNEAAYRYARGNWTEQEARQVFDLAETFLEEMVGVFNRPPASHHPGL